MRTKKQASYTIAKEILEKFDKLADEKAINKSKLLERYMERWIEENEEEQ